MNKLKSLPSGPSRDSFFLMLVRLITIVLGLATSRLLSDALSLTEYGTYSQIMLLVSTITSFTILGMIDGSNYFFYNNDGENQRNQYIATIFSLQYMFALLTGVVLLIVAKPLVAYFENERLRNLLIFAAILPLLQNMLSILQVLFIAIGKARQIAIRNLIFSILRIVLFAIACHVLRSIFAIFVFLALMDTVQIVYFWVVLRKNHCRISIFNTNFKLLKSILCYCVPMAAFLIVSTLSRDCDKYVISAFTDTETLAMYSNAAKMLPLDIVYTSFITVLMPYITRFIADHSFEQAKKLYSLFMEVAVMTTSILAGAVIAAAPMLIELLYTKKYMAGLNVFVIYVLVDIVRTFNITLVLSAAGKSKDLLSLSVLSLAANMVLNILLFNLLGVIGPAISTFLTTFASGIAIQYKASKILQCRLSRIFYWEKTAEFIFMLILTGGVFVLLSKFLLRTNLHYLMRLIIVGGGFGVTMLLLCGKHLLECIKEIGNYRLQSV